MGRLLTMPPSDWEAEYIEGLVLGIRHEAATGEMPIGPLWSMLERRYDLNPERFSIHHPNVAALIERSREHRGLDRAELGRRAGLSRMVVSNLELGKTRAFMEQIAGLAGALGIAPALLVAAASHEDRRLTRGERCMVVLHPEHWPARYG